MVDAKARIKQTEPERKTKCNEIKRKRNQHPNPNRTAEIRPDSRPTQPDPVYSTLPHTPRKPDWRSYCLVPVLVLVLAHVHVHVDHAHAHAHKPDSLPGYWNAKGGRRPNALWITSSGIGIGIVIGSVGGRKSRRIGRRRMRAFFGRLFVRSVVRCLWLVG
jgi:hypothetical protein